MSVGLLTVMLALPLVGAVPGEGLPPRPGGPAIEMEHGHAGHLHGPELDALADAPFRPEWAPLPLLHGLTTAVPLLDEVLATGNAVERARSAFLLGQVGAGESAQHLVQALADPDRGVRIHSGIALASMGDDRGLHAAVASLRSEQPWVRYYAVHALWRLGSPQALAALQANRHGQGILVTEAIDGALETPLVLPPAVPPVEDTPVALPEGGLDEVWVQAADVFVRESDWWWHCGEYEQVIRASEADIFLDPTHAETYTVIAWLQWSLGRDAEAVGTLRRAVRVLPGDPESHFGLGHHYFNTGRFALAEEPLRMSVELGGDHLARRAYAHCLERLGKLSEARDVWAALLEDRPGDGSVQRNYDRLKRLLETP